MLAVIPEWLVRAVFSYAATWAFRKLGLNATVVHFEAAVAKVRPLSPDPLPPPVQNTNPNMSNPHDRGGWVGE